MGIKGLYRELGKGERIALAKLAVNHYTKNNGRKYRVAIDISIWLFQIQSSQGGYNSELRTLYYRLLRLMSSCIQPLFVFDGTNKPAKRNKKSAAVPSREGSILIKKAKILIDVFGFLWTDAPGEAEAECAALQIRGLVDAVISDDVDTLMFGCTKLIRDFSTDDKKKTHVNVYDSASIAENHKINRWGIVLVALASGGDYGLAGIPGCGIKTACEMARAGFGKDLCILPSSETADFQEWREHLIYELNTNESGYFRNRHKALKIPDDFPNRKILDHYRNPLVSSTQDTLRFGKPETWNKSLDVSQLCQLVDREFCWADRSGAIKLIRTLTPALLVHKLTSQKVDQVDDTNDSITSICGRRVHFATDGLPEIRISYTPIDIVEIDIGEKTSLDNDWSIDRAQSTEITSRATTSDLVADDHHQPPESGHLRSEPYNPYEAQRVWVIEAYVKNAVPGLLAAWDAENSKRSTSKGLQEPQNARPKDQTFITGFLKVSKQVHSQASNGNIARKNEASLQHTVQSVSNQKYSNRRKIPKPTSSSKDVIPWTRAKAVPVDLNMGLANRVILENIFTGENQVADACEQLLESSTAASTRPDTGISKDKKATVALLAGTVQQTASATQPAHSTFTNGSSSQQKGYQKRRGTKLIGAQMSDSNQTKSIDRILLRESLEGSWKTGPLDGEPLHCDPCKEYSAVAVVDLTDT